MKIVMQLVQIPMMFRDITEFTTVSTPSSLAVHLKYLCNLASKGMIAVMQQIQPLMVMARIRPSLRNLFLHLLLLILLFSSPSSILLDPLSHLEYLTPEYRQSLNPSYPSSHPFYSKHSS